MELTNKVIVITGGSGLLGSAFCKTVANKNGIAIIADINEKASRNLETAINHEKGKLHSEYHPLNINDEDSINTLITNLHSKYGRIDALVNNAYPRNKHYGRKFFDVTYSDFCENVNLNLGGYFLVTQLFSKYFINQGFGNIINIASVYGVIAPKFEIYEGTNMTMPVEYAVIKSGLIHLTKYLAKLLKNKNIRINSISPGGIKDAQPDSFLASYKEKCLNKGMLDTTDICGTLLFLISEESKMINGQNIVVDDGFTL